MADNLGLDQDEMVILREPNVAHGNLLSMYMDELFLTNKKIIYVNKNMFGGVKKIDYYPLNLIKIFNGIPQVQQGKLSNGLVSLDVYMLNCEEHFCFLNQNMKTITAWVEEIWNQLGVSKSSYESFTVDGPIIGAFKDTGRQFAEAFGFKFKSKKPVNNLNSHVPPVIDLDDIKSRDQTDNNSTGYNEIRCASCGKILPPGSLFCTECGAAVTDKKQDSQIDEIVCPSCGKHLAPGFRFCTECGAEIKISDTGSHEPQDKEETESTTSQKEKLTIEQQIELLQKLKSLLDAGIISQEEFEKKKKEIL